MKQWIQIGGARPNTGTPGSSSSLPGVATSVTITEIGPRTLEPDQSTHTILKVTPVFTNPPSGMNLVTLYITGDAGVTWHWYGAYSFTPGVTTYITFDFLVPTLSQAGVSSNNVKAYIVAGGVAGGPTALTTSQLPAGGAMSAAITVLLASPASSGTGVVASLLNVQGSPATTANVFMGMNSLGNPYAEIIFKLTTAGGADPNTWFYDVTVDWVDASGNEGNPGGVNNPAGEREFVQIVNDGTTQTQSLLINYPATGSPYNNIRWKVYGVNRSNTATPAFTATDGTATLMACWPSSATSDTILIGDAPTGAGPGTWYSQVPEGATDGTNSIYTLDYAPAPYDILVRGSGTTGQGYVQNPDTQYSITNYTLTYTGAGPSASEFHRIWYFKGKAAPVPLKQYTYNTTSATSWYNQVIGSNIYYVTVAQLYSDSAGTIAPSWQPWIQKSTDHGVTFGKNLYKDTALGSHRLDPFCVCSSGATIYIFGYINTTPAPFLVAIHWDTITDSVTHTEISSISNSSPITACAYSDGTILLSISNAVVHYDPATHTFGTPVTVIGGAAGQINDPATDIQYVFRGNGHDLYCVPVTSPATTHTAVSIGTYSVGHLEGIPAISNGYVVLPVQSPASDSSSDVLFVVRAATGTTTPTFTTVSPVDSASTGTRLMISAKSNVSFGATCVDIDGALMMFYAGGNASMGTSSSVGSLFYQCSRDGGATWSGRQTVDTESTGGQDPLVPYPARKSSTQAFVIWGTWNQSGDGDLDQSTLNPHSFTVTPVTLPHIRLVGTAIDTASSSTVGGPQEFTDTSFDGEAGYGYPNGATTSNGIFSISGNLYCITIHQYQSGMSSYYAGATFHARKSTDNGATWTAAATFDYPPVPFSSFPTYPADGFCAFVKGGKIHCMFLQSESLTICPLVYLVYDPALDSWSGPTTITTDPYGNGDAGNDATQGPYACYLRSNGDVVVLFGDSSNFDWYAAGTHLYVGVWKADGTWVSAVPVGVDVLTDNGMHVESSYIDSSDDVTIFFSQDYEGGHFYTAKYDHTNSLSSSTDLGTSPINSYYSGFLGGSIGYGIANTVPIADTAGNVRLLQNSSGTWSITSALDTTQPSGAKCIGTPLMHQLGSYLVMVYRGLETTGGPFQYSIRVGYAPVASAGTPASWTWATVYDFAAPSPLVSGSIGPYRYWDNALTQCLIKGDDGKLRYHICVKDDGASDNEWIVIDLLEIS